MFFRYDMITDDAARAIYDKFLRAEAMRFVKWRASDQRRVLLALEVAFQRWWTFHGTTKVAYESLLQFKRALYTKAQEITGNA